MALTAMAASGAALLLLWFLITPRLEAWSVRQTEATLVAEARLMARVVAAAQAAGAGDHLDALVDEAARDVRARVTIVAPDGRVLADSAVSGVELAALENHLQRPEVQAALRSGQGSARRHSDTLGRELLYVAVSVRLGTRLTGVARVAQPLDAVAAETRALQRALAVAGLVAFAVTATLSTLLRSSLAGPLERLMRAARELGAGQVTTRIEVARDDELGELARILNASAQRLEERMAEGARERARGEAILAAMEEGLLAVDQRGIVLVANERLRQSLGLADPRGRHFVEAVRQREVGELVQAVLDTGRRQVGEVEMPRLRRAWSVTAVPFPGPEGAPHGAVLTFHEVTERRALERVRRDFVANASHELRTPLTSIRGFVEALEDGALDEPGTARRFLGKIRTHADRMTALVSDLLELSRLESGTQAPRFERLRPADLAEDTLASLARAAEARGVVLNQVGTDAPVVVSDPERLLRILNNLVDNAIKYTPQGGRVDLESTADPHGGALLHVRDNGPGIAPEHLKRIFERFYRVDTARSRELGGTGLGLAIVRHLAESIGATVSVESEVGRGTCFTVALPADPRPAPAGPGGA
jgi:two-component system phosphate regulon sensor histidine kinase PhoR